MHLYSILLGTTIVVPQVLSQHRYIRNNRRTRLYGSSFGTPGTDKSFDYVVCSLNLSPI